jgi:non-ribosomal peptide synthetase component F/acyl carrier protein
MPDSAAESQKRNLSKIRPHSLALQLPSPMIPTLWSFPERLPQLNNGKVDRSRLSKPPVEVTDEGRAGRASNTHTELVANAMASVLGMSQVHPEDNFFACGGDSLRAASLAALLRKQLNVAVPTSAVLQSPTPESLARRLQLFGPVSKMIALHDWCGDVALSSAQQRLWLYQRLYPESCAHNVGLLIRWPGRSQDRVRRSLGALVDSFPILNASGLRSDGVWAIPTPQRWRIEAPGAESSLEAIVREELSRPFDLSRSAPWRVRLVQEEQSTYGVLTFHQIVVDQHSLQLMVKILSAEPRNESGGTGELATQQAAVQRLISTSNPEHLIYWESQFAEPLVDQNYPRDIDGPELGDEVCRRRHTFPPGTVKVLKEFAAHQATTPFTVLLAALAIALHYWTGLEDLLLAAAFSLREEANEAFDSALGFFAEALPLRVAVRPGGSTDELLRRVHQLVVEAQHHKHCPADLINVALARSRRQPSNTPFPILFGLLPSLGNDLPAEADVDAIDELFAPHLESEIHLQVRWSPSELSFVLDGRPNHYSPGNLERLARHWRRAVHNLLSGAQRIAVRRRTRAHEVSSVYAAFARSAEAHPSSPALVTSHATTTFDELAQHVLNVAAALRDTSPGPCALVFRDQGLSIVAALACLGEHRAFVPISADWAPTRAAVVATTIGSVTFLCEAGTREFVNAMGGVEVIEVSRTLSRRGERVDPVIGPPDACAYVLFTSGTTGRAKGVAQSHANLFYHIRTYAEGLGLRPEDRLALLTTIEFDAGLMDVFGAAITGASLHPWPVAANGLAELPNWIETQQISILHCTPSVFRALVRCAPDLGRRVKSVRAVVLGGEPARREDLIAFQREFPLNAVLVNGFGPTECTTATRAILSHDSAIEGAMLPIGEAIADVRVIVSPLDSRTHVETGELILEGTRLFRGYVKSPGDIGRIDARRQGLRFHRTGDLVRRLPDGKLLHLGRRDQEAKIGGARVDLSEIEHCIREAMPGLIDTVVVSHGPRRQHLTAFVAGDPAQMTDMKRFKADLSDRLPSRAMPNSFRLLERLPYLGNGKVDRRALQRAAEVQREASHRDISVNEVRHNEQHLALVWAEVLELEVKPGPDATFLSLGGRSLEALMVMDRFRARFGVKLPANAMLGGG